MSKAKIIFLGYMLCLTAAGCANAASDRETTLLDSGDILVISKNNKGQPVASYISTQMVDSNQLAQRMIRILKLTNSGASILQFAESRLPSHPRLKKENFTVPLTSKDGMVYEFMHSSDFENKLFILNYKFKGRS
ncbi:MAG: hypothetical protein OEZ39_08325 [Gammaproteobacteria bacterium]|nr:hypothetical protein [Gammaproteobacteria bacterium]MDH5651867.1 hypothetical protein [Gammaproteobacteria bacterium]